MKKSPQPTAWYNPEIASDMVKGALCQLEGWQKLENSDHFPVLEALLKMIPSELKKLADTGCGAGEISRVFPSYNYTGFDLPHIIEEVALKVNPDSRYKKIDIQEVNFGIFSSFNIVLCNSFISELENGEDVLNSFFKSAPDYIILHRQEMTKAGTHSKDYETYGNLTTLKCILAEDSIKESCDLYGFSCLKAFRLGPDLYSFLFKKNEATTS
jgi:hypothetical protein